MPGAARRRRIIAGAAVLVALALLAAGAGSAQVTVPHNEGWVTDLAGFLTPEQERSLETLMESYKQGSGNEIALLTVPDLGGQSLERYALEVGRQWGIGEQGKNNGALLLVARKERKIRIEVGRGLEGTLTDSISGRIIRDVIAPRFKQGHYYEGLRDGIEAMHAAAGGDYASLPPERKREKSRPLAGLIPLLFLLFLLISIFRRGGRGRGGVLPWLIAGSALGRGSRSGGWHSGGYGGGGFGGFGGGGGFSGGGASGGW